MNTDRVPTCVFCEIVSGHAPALRLREGTDHLAFLSIFPNTVGFSVVVPKAHRTSHVVDLEPSEYAAPHLAAREVARRLDAAFDDVARTGIMYEGYGDDHAHTELFPHARHHRQGGRELARGGPKGAAPPPSRVRWLNSSTAGSEQSGVVAHGSAREREPLHRCEQYKGLSRVLGVTEADHVGGVSGDGHLDTVTGSASVGLAEVRIVERGVHSSAS